MKKNFWHGMTLVKRSNCSNLSGAVTDSDILELAANFFTVLVMYFMPVRCIYWSTLIQSFLLGVAGISVLR